ncbi:hypothetical protein HPP92_004597 [Vanilla planifolia]|uniref:Uncharacterized protein n=1 Tax=Vanilla planifolia TaxID=51239 RepID=A0A835S4Q3_VANPL|nr:hypothetical protein HPP92_004597 [Vanilla planifolia]
MPFQNFNRYHLTVGTLRGQDPSSSPSKKDSIAFLERQQKKAFRKQRMASTQNATPTAPQRRSSRYLQSMDEEIKSSILSPKFLSAAAMAGWDEEALLIATLVVEDTPVRESQLRKRRSRHLQSPLTTSSNRKRRSRRQTAEAIPSLVLCVDDNGDASSYQVLGHDVIKRMEKRKKEL